MIAPNPDDYFAEWNRREARGARKGSTNLWIYEKDTRQKKFSVTNEAGSKIQPYFDIPPASDPNLYILTVIGEYINLDEVRVWVTRSTIRELEHVIGSIDTDSISKLILDTTKKITSNKDALYLPSENVIPLVLKASAYAALTASLPGKSDEHCFQQLVHFLKQTK